MKHGYAYAKTKAEARTYPDALLALGAERVWVDTTDSERGERAGLFSTALRSGDVLVLLARSHLGDGKEPQRFEGIAADKGVTFEIAPAPPKAKPGPASDFQPSYAQERRCRHFWHGPFKRSVALAEVSKTMERRVTASQLNKHLGPRSKPKPWISKPEAKRDD